MLAELGYVLAKTPWTMPDVEDLAES